MNMQTAPTSLITPDQIRSHSWSEVKTWQRCPKQWDYKYGQNLVPKTKSAPLFMGSWVHKCLETHYIQGDWKIGHQEYVNEYNKLFEEEREALEKKKKGALPDLVSRIMKSYLWYNRHETWEVLFVEHEFEVQLKGPYYIKGIIDLIIRDENGLIWVIDHKTAASIPESGAFHAMDPQLMVYPWAAAKTLGIDPAGVIYNYVRSRPPSIPKLNKDGTLSKRKITTDYPTVARFLKQNGYDPKDEQWSPILRPLYKKSPFLRRYRLPREKHVTLEVLQDFLTSSVAIRDHKRTPRVITKDCYRGCSYHDLCRAELNGFDTEPMRKHDFTIRTKRQDYVEPGIDDDDDSTESE